MKAIICDKCKKTVTGENFHYEGIVECVIMERDDRGKPFTLNKWHLCDDCLEFIRNTIKS